MDFDLNKYLWIFISCLIRTSYELNCLQCTSPIQHVSQNWNYSCLGGTLPALPCQEPTNGSEVSYKQCVSALYRVGQRGIQGVLIYRACTAVDTPQHECDPPTSLIDFEKPDYFYCSRTCSGDECNRHLVEAITSNTKQLFQKLEFLFLYFISWIFLFKLRCSCFS